MNNFKNHKVFVMVFLLITGTTSVTQARESKGNDALSANNAKVSLIQAVNTALSTIAGKAANVEFSNDDGVAVWEVEVISVENKVYDIEINAQTGILVKKELDSEDDADDEDDS